MERLPGPLLVASRDPLPESLDRYRESYEVNRPEPAAQKRLWQRALGPAAANLEAHLDDIAEQFRLSAETVFFVARSTAGRIQLQASIGESEAAKSPSHAEQLWNACRAISRPRLDDLADRIASGTRPAQWNDLVLPELQKQILCQMAAQLRHRLQVYETWGFSERGRRGLGLSALFCGHSGTGKTWAAEVLAAELKLDLYRIDLSAVVSKYIGETEKNLKQVFDAAECGGVVLLFDEADALFGKRAEVKDGRDRYANMEVGYLLQRMENFGGLAILTTNLKASLDRAFQRRLRFIVDFPFPDAAQREAIWGRIFPKDAPTQGLDLKRLAQLNMTGGNIRNIALNAAFLAADAGTPVEMRHLLQATRLEAMKAERPLAESEIRGWI
jgi:SpoVK/Ycf46/Vps4 family AAA+-type ATPase